MSTFAGVSSAINPCHSCTIDCWATCDLRSGYRGVYPNGNGWLAKRQVDGKRVIFGTQDSPQAAAALLLHLPCPRSTAAQARGVKRKAPVTPLAMCDHVPQGSEEGSLSAELNALAKKEPYRLLLSPLRAQPLERSIKHARFSASGYLMRRGLTESQKAGGGICSK